MAEKIQRETLLKNEHAILNKRYRVRLFPTVDVPVLCNLQTLLGPEVVVFDLPDAEGLEKHFLDAEKSIRSDKFNARSTDYNKENIVPEGCTIGGDPLEVSFLTIEKLEKTSKHKSKVAFDSDQLIESTPFNAHLMTSLESHDAINDLKDAFDSSLANVSHVILADASACQNLLFLARQRGPKQLTDVQATYLGNMKDAVHELNVMTGQLQVLQMRRCVCRCRFDVLRNMLYSRRHSDFREASFSIQAEWSVQLPKAKIQRKVIPFDNLLAMPPDNAKVVVKFKPGWMDERVELTNNVCELKHLSDLALSLKAGKIPWKMSAAAAVNDDDGGDHAGETDGEAAEALILQGVAELIERARDRPDIESVYPFDFTDRLWEVICRVNSTETLKSVFEMIYAEMRTGEFRVMVEKDKESSLAKMLRVRTLGNMVFPRLEPLTCLQMLVEIGVDRFKGDMQHRFIKSEFITNVIELEPFFLHASAPVEERIEQLMPLYLALQSMLMIEKFVCLTPHKKMLMAKRLLSHFTALKNVETNSKEFSFEAYMEDICRENLKPSMTEWLIERSYEQPLANARGGAATPIIAASKSGGNGSFVHEIAFFTKFIGFAHVATVTRESPPTVTETQPALVKATNSLPPVLGAQDANRLTAVVKNEVRSATNTPSPARAQGARSTSLAPSVEEQDDEEDSVETDEQMLFDCVYVLATNTSIAALGDGGGTSASALASKSPSPAMLAASIKA